MPRIVLALTFISTLMGCATTSKVDTRIDKRLTPPIPSFLARYQKASLEELEKIEVGVNEDRILWWKTYMVAMKNKDTKPAQACEGFKTLASAMEFPLHDLALLRAYETCAEKSSLPELPSSIAPWYQELYVDSKLKDAESSEGLDDDLEALTAKARLESQKKNKEELYMKALLIAQKMDKKEAITELQTQLYKNSPRLNPLPAFKDLSAVASDYRFHREFDQALKTYKKILDTKEATAEDQFQALKNIRQTLKVAQRRTDYINATADLVNWAKNQFQKNKKDRRALARYHDSQVLFAKTLWTEDQTSRAVRVLNETHRQLRGQYPMDEVYFILGRIEEEKGAYLKALEYFEASYTQPVSFTGLREKISWLKSWNYYKLQKWTEALKSLEEMKNQVKDPADKARASFWTARTLKYLQRTEEAKQELETLAQEDPLGFYGVMAVRELQRGFTPLKPSDTEMATSSLLSVNEMTPATRITTEWLIAVHEKAFAEKVLNNAVADLKKSNVVNEDTWLTVFSGYARTGLYLPLFAAIGGLDSKVKDKLLNDHPDLLFPRPFSEMIREASEKSGIPKEFIYSIIRQESAFNPEARSPADAFGLMQLLPSVARQLAQKNGVPYQEAGDLFKPEINIPLGAFELKALMKRYNDQFILAVSGYNASDSAIRGWIKTRFREDPVEFIEEVPYEETRAYIKLTMRNYVFYRRLLDQQESLKFPEELLKLTQPR